MQMTWSWPIAESVHFIGLCLLVGAVGVFDLRLLGIGRRIPARAMHRLIPWGLAGFALSVSTGILFVVTYPDQYIYNPSFHVKMVLLLIAGANASLFYLTAFRRLDAPAAGDVPRTARVIAAISLSAWLVVIVCGRMITFYRPSPCARPPEGVLLTCVPR
jgi:hypothetical protein